MGKTAYAKRDVLLIAEHAEGAIKAVRNLKNIQGARELDMAEVYLEVAQMWLEKFAGKTPERV